MRQIIKKPIISEKSFAAGHLNKFCFWVDKYADKATIAKITEEMFKVEVIKVNTGRFIGKNKNTRGKSGKRNDLKKVTLTLKPGQKISLFEAEVDSKKVKEPKKTKAKVIKADKEEIANKGKKI